ncbi:MAG: HlyD family secretion protein [Proteobacteria bacterium]|nr:HlyD family secretion protein [Pseudomonadota bacterium]
MDLLLILTYTAICVAVFKVFRIPLNKWTVPTAVLGGILLIGTLIVLMNYNHPYSEMSQEYFVTTPIVPVVSGRVIDVPVVQNTPLKKGDILLQLDPVPFKHKLESIEARLKQSEADLKRANELVVKNAMSIRDRDLAQSQFDQLTAEKATAKYELEQTTVRALANGYVTQVIVRPGMMATSLPIRPLMIFVNEEKNYFVGWFRQNSLLRLTLGDKAEVIYDAIPGVIFSAKVHLILPVLAEGQVSASGELVSMKMANQPGRVPVIIEIDDPKFAKYQDILPGGAAGQTAVYSQHFHHVAIMRKVLLRMAAWMNYIFPFH